MALYLKDESTFELEITKYNIDDFSAERKKEGYLCTIEGIFFFLISNHCCRDPELSQIPGKESLLRTTH